MLYAVFCFKFFTCKALADFSFEDALINQGYVAGVDEVGYGALCGPLVSCAVILNRDIRLPYINDSKSLSLRQREEAYSLITNHHYYSIGMASSQEIDLFNVRNAAKISYSRAIENLRPYPGICLLDGNIGMEGCVNVIKGDCKSLSIAAASIVAKVFRDHLMSELHEMYSEYMWCLNKGYGTREHFNAIKQYGSSVHHRKSFLKNFFQSDKPSS